ncbi:MAG: MFS transporter [Candidatus Omnitrophica bacterium]|nr:MFS transporter [Candidatus Omnitrophota bacterium]
MLAPYIRILKRRDFFLLWFGQIISQFGDRLTQMALIGLVYRLEPGSPLGLAKMLSLAIIPVFLFSPAAGVYIDRWDKRKTMYLADILRGIFIVVIPLLLTQWQSVAAIYCLVFLSFSSGRFFVPAKMAIVPFLVEKEDLFLANSLISVTAMIAAVLGFGLGGIIVERWGVSTAFYVDAVTFFFSGACVFLMSTKEKAKFAASDFLHLGKDALERVKESFVQEAKQGIAYLFSSPETRYATKIFFLLFASIGSLYTIFIVFVQNALSTVTFELGLLAVGAGAGLFLGALGYGRIASGFSVKKAINYSLFFSSTYLLVFTLTLNKFPSFPLALISCALLGVLVAPIIIAINSLIHHESANEFWGRIFSSLEIIIHFAFLLFMFLSSYLANLFTPFTIIVGISIIMILASFIHITGSRNDPRTGI